MTMPRFTEEASLYQTSGQYRIGRQAIPLERSTVSDLAITYQQIGRANHNPTNGCINVGLAIKLLTQPKDYDRRI